MLGKALGRVDGSDVVRRRAQVWAADRGLWKEQRKAWLECSRPGRAHGVAGVAYRDRGGSQVSAGCRVTPSPSFGNGAPAQNDSEWEHGRLGCSPPEVIWASLLL